MQPQQYSTYFNNQSGSSTPTSPSAEPRGRGARPYTGAKRGRKPRGGGPNTAAPSTPPEGIGSTIPAAYSYATLTLTPPSQLQAQAQAQAQKPSQAQSQTSNPVQPPNQTQMPPPPTTTNATPATTSATTSTTTSATSMTTTASTIATTTTPLITASTSSAPTTSTAAPVTFNNTTVTVPPPTPIPASYYTSHPPAPFIPPYIPAPFPSTQKGKGKEESTRVASSTTTVPPPTYRSPATTSATPPTFQMRYSSHGQPVMALSPAGTQMHSQIRPQPHIGTMSSANAAAVAAAAAAAVAAAAAAEEDDDAEDLPLMSDDVYGQGLLWQSQSKENLKILMDNFTPEQFERYEAYRRSALPKQSVRKVIQQTTPYTASQPVAQVMAGFAKVFVGEIIEKARALQAKWGEPPETPLSPEHLREAYRLYQEETGKVGAARVHKGKRLFVR